MTIAVSASGWGEGAADVPIISQRPWATPSGPVTGTPGTGTEPVPAGPTATADPAAPGAVAANGTA